MLLYVLVRLKECFRQTPPPPLPADCMLPELTLFITAYNEEDVVDDKMRNSLSLDYPADKLHILWITDGSNDRTNERLSHWPQATVLYQPQREGKTAALNRGIRFVTTPLVVFTDANTHLNREALREIVRAFANPKVGCVAGEKRIALQDKATLHPAAKALLEIRVRPQATGLPPLLCRRGSRRVVCHPSRAVRGDACRHTAGRLHPLPAHCDARIYHRLLCRCLCRRKRFGRHARRRKRKVRIAAGGLQSVWRLRALLNPLRYGVFCFQYISHRVLRWSLTPVLLFLLFPLNTILIFTSNTPLLYAVIWLLQALFYFMASVGALPVRQNIYKK